MPENIGLALIGRITPYPGLLAMEQIRQDRDVMDVGGSGHYSMDDLGLAVDPDVGLYPFQGVHAEVPLIPLRGPPGSLFPLRLPTEMPRSRALPGETARQLTHENRHTMGVFGLYLALFKGIFRRSSGTLCADLNVPPVYRYPIFFIKKNA